MLRLLYFATILVFLTIIGGTTIPSIDASKFIIEQSETQNAMRSPVTIALTADKGSDTINLTGHSISTSEMEIKIIFPSGKKLVSQYLLTPDSEGDFTIEFNIDDTWIENGFYKISFIQTISENELLDSQLYVKVNNGLITEPTHSMISKLVTDKTPISPVPFSEVSLGMESWKNMRGELVKIFSSSVDTLLERGYLIEKF